MALLVRHHQVSLGCLTSMEFLKCTNHMKKQICGNLEIWLMRVKNSTLLYFDQSIASLLKLIHVVDCRKFVENLPQGVHVNFLKAERSLHRWALEDLQRIHAAEDLAAEEGAGVEMHVLEDAGHWVFFFCML